MRNQVPQSDPYIGRIVSEDYILTEERGKGKIGTVYKAVRSDPYDELACKVIASDNLRQGWDAELNKVLKLRMVPGVVQYHRHGTGEYARAVGGLSAYAPREHSQSWLQCLHPASEANGFSL